MLRIYNTLSRNIEEFKPLRDKIVKMYTCGPSIYQRAHIGNFRTFLFEDVLLRYLEYLRYKIERVLNFTDVEEKSIQEARRLGMPLKRLSEKNARAFIEDMKILRLKYPDHIPRSSTSIKEAVNLIRILLKKGYAYGHQGNIYFEPLKFKNFGKLAKLDMKTWPKKKRRFHKDTYPDNRWNKGDFILWHGHKNGDSVYWDTPIGRGRPAWNIQDPAMAIKHLGFTFDIFCGGIDNLARHHDYTIAVAESISGKMLAKYWLHGAHLLVDGKKMSKSRGNVIYIDNLTKLGYTGEDVRFFLIYSQYWRRMNFTFEKFRKTLEKLNRVKKMIADIQRYSSLMGKTSERVKMLLEKITTDFENSMKNNLDVKTAFDNTSKNILKLAKLKDKNMVRGEDIKALNTKLSNIDRVLQIF